MMGASPAADYGDGVVVAVGGPNRTSSVEVAASLGLALSDRGVATLVADFDEHTPLLAARLGLDQHPSVAAARKGLGAEPGAFLDRPVLSRLTEYGFEVLVGAQVDEAEECPLRAGEARVILIGAASQWHITIGCVGPMPPSPPQLVDTGKLGYRAATPVGTGHGDGFAVSRQVVESADVVVACIQPTPLGLLEGLDWAIEAARLNEGEMWIVFTHRPKSLYRRREFADEATATLGRHRVAGVVFAPIGHQRHEAAWSSDFPTTDSFAKNISAFAAKLIDPFSSNSSRRHAGR